VLSLAVAGSAAATSEVHAQPRDARQRAEAPYKEGVDLAKAGKAEAALAKFEAAYSLSPTGMAVQQIARMEQILGRHALALQHFREALRDPNLTTEARRDAEKAVEELKTRVGVITLDVPAGATTTIDGNEVDPRSSVEVVPGLHVVKVRLAGESKSVDVTSPAGAVTPVKVRFGEDPPKPAVGSASGTSDPALSPAPVATEAPPGSWTTGRIAGAAFAGTGIAALGLGVIFQLGASSAADDAANIRGELPEPRESACNDPRNRERCADLRSKVDDQHSSEDLRTGFLVAGATLVVGGAVLFLMSVPKREPSRGARLVPLAADRAGGLAVVGRF
jgi:tetratricopeptide (TPR) repeat protein